VDDGLSLFHSMPKGGGDSGYCGSTFIPSVRFRLAHCKIFCYYGYARPTRIEFYAVSLLACAIVFVLARREGGGGGGGGGGAVGGGGGGAPQCWQMSPCSWSDTDNIGTQGGR
jgi:hypothetical protein